MIDLGFLNNVSFTMPGFWDFTSLLGLILSFWGTLILAYRGFIIFEERMDTAQTEFEEQKRGGLAILRDTGVLESTDPEFQFIKQIVLSQIDNDVEIDRLELNSDAEGLFKEIDVITTQGNRIENAIYDSTISNGIERESEFRANRNKERVSFRGLMLLLAGFFVQIISFVAQNFFVVTN
ncbi:hypothetical protein [Haloarchaeobius sp. DYHT-AS-18]|uniref:hypothetical protein n=1 Tax=Haloarchaeobius sp. DYHT-AS-18 TaxID=3446117 RepID=UPI003EB7C2A6